MITPRQTRLFRAADLRAFQRTIRRLAGHTDVRLAQSCAVIVPSAAAADQLRRTLENHRLLGASPADRTLCLPQILTRSGWYDAMHSRLPSPPRRLTDLEREVLLNAVARDIAASDVEPPFRLLNEHSLPFVAASVAQAAASPIPCCGGPCADLSPVRIYINNLLIVQPAALM